MTQADEVTAAAASAAPRARSGAGVIDMVRTCRPVLGEDYGRLPVLVGGSFVLGFLESGLVLLVVQMAVALAGGEDTFSVGLGPWSIDDLTIAQGVQIALVLVATLIATLWPVARLGGALAARAQQRTRSQLLDAYLAADWRTRSRYPEGHLQELLTTYTQRAELAVTHLVTTAVALCGLLAVMTTAFLAAPLFAVIAIICVFLVGATLRPLIRKTRRMSGRYADDDRVFASRMAELARVTPEIAAFDVAQPVRSIVEERSAEVSESLRVVRILSRLGASLYNYIAMLLVVVSVALLSAFGDEGALATIGSVLLLFVRALSYGQQLQSMLQSTNETRPFLVRIQDELQVLGAGKEQRVGRVIPAPVPLRLDGVHFAYDPDDPVLRGVDLSIEPGEAVGIIGRSGTGKSTIVQLLLRLYRPDAGSITAGGIPLVEVDLGCWHDLVAYVPQDNKLVTGTVADNIAFFRPGITQEAIEDAARRAHVHDDIAALPLGYATPVGPGVRDLSGGQRQRLGIARALAGAPTLIVLDEPTSALDGRSEALVSRTLESLKGTVTLVIVAHRPATAMICDRTYRIADGRAEAIDRALLGSHLE